MQVKENITQAELKSRLYYDPWTGVFTWINPNPQSRIKPGSRAGCIKKSCSGKSYISINFNYVLYGAHRLAFLYMIGVFPDDQVDHTNGNGLDNRWGNLRQADALENSRNNKVYSNNTTGITGVHVYKRNQKYCADIRVKGKLINLGYFDNLLDAACARKSAEKHYNFHQNHGQVRAL